MATKSKIVGTAPNEQAPRNKFSLEALPAEKRRQVLDVFVRNLEKYLSSDADSEMGKKNLMETVQKDAGLTGSLDSRQMDSFLRHLKREGYLRFGYHFASERADSLRQRFSQVGITVVAGSDPERFAQAAAEDFINEVFRIGKEKQKRGKDEVLNVGIVSGNTTGASVRTAEKLEWMRDLGLEAARLPNMRIFALNVCLTVPEHLPGNANLLVHSFADKINREAGTKKADAYGLSAPLMVEKARLKEADEAPQTFEVVEFTEPFRVLPNPKYKRSKSIDPHHTELDIVLTGVGELPMSSQRGTQPTSGSIFYNLAKEFGFNMDEIIEQERIVGDLAFTAIKSDGEPVFLRKARARSAAGPLQASSDEALGDDETEFVFYSAVQLPVFEAMANNRSKSVILVARHDEGKYKVPAIFASIAGERHRYASRLVIDEPTAQKLIHY